MEHPSGGSFPTPTSAIINDLVFSVVEGVVGVVADVPTAVDGRAGGAGGVVVVVATLRAAGGGRGAKVSMVVVVIIITA